MRTKEELISAIKKYNPDLPNSEKARIELAYTFAQEKHAGQKRASGEEYFSHPLEVAFIAAEEYELDTDSIISALLHDVVEDTKTSIKTIKNLFGESVAELVTGLTKLRSIKITSPKILKAENYRNFVLSVSKDIRVLIIKLIDRYHNITTLQYHKSTEKKQRIALETLTIYIPLAERMGMEKLKTQMENICFKELYPQEFHFIEEKLETLRKSGTNLIEPIVDELSDLTTRHKIKAQIYGREKSPYSIWRKMNNKNITFDEIFDIIAFRFIVEDVEDCYKILGMIHSTYKMIPNRFKDYISTPKPNKYQSLHTSVIGPLNKRIEIQIRTREMDKVAQYGYAAHWLYKEGKTDLTSKDFDWLRNMVDAIKHVSSPDEIVENTKLSPFIDSIFCFTPNGDLIDLPIGATALDFAYEIHSNIGNHCVGAKINKVIKNIRTPLKTGDMVEILTSKIQNPSPEWERFVVTLKAKNAIKHYLKQQRKQQTILYGKQLLQTSFENYKQPFSEKKLNTILNKYGASTLDDLYLLIGSKEYTPDHILFSLYPDLKNKEQKNNFNIDSFFNSIAKNTFEKAKEKEKISDGVLANIPVHFAKCCYPVPGDEIIGIIHTGKGITIHKKTCNTLERYKNTPEKLFNLNWDDYSSFKNSTFQTKIAILAKNTPGALNEITSILAKENANIDYIKIISKTEEYTDILFTINVKNIEHLNNIISNLKNAKMINTVIKYNN